MFFVSISVFALSVLALAIWGLNFGVDFTGGSTMEVEFKDQRPNIQDIEKVLREISDLEFSTSPTGDLGIIIRTSELSESQHQSLLSGLTNKFPSGFEERSFDSVGPTVGRELRSKSIVAIIIVLAVIAFYIAIVFRKLSKTLSLWAMNGAALVSLLHDIIIPMGVFSVLGRYYNVEIGAVFVAAALTILGYTVSDKVVIFDRVRENIIRGDKSNLGHIVHKSVMQTLVRSINNTLTVILSSAAIFIFGGDSIKYFALALMIGIFLGAYSSIFVASPLLVWWSDKIKRG